MGQRRINPLCRHFLEMVIKGLNYFKAEILGSVSFDVSFRPWNRPRVNGGLMDQLH
jgi:hypothetical protein